MFLLLFSLAVIWEWLTVGFTSPDGPSFLPLFLPFLPSIRNSHSCGATAGGTRLPTSFLYEFSTKRMWVYFSFPSSSSGAITQHCSPNRDRHEGCVLVRRLQRGFAIPALLANSCGSADGPPQPFLDGHPHQTCFRSSHSL